MKKKTKKKQEHPKHSYCYQACISGTDISSSNLLGDKTQFVRICSSWQMKLVALEALLNTERAGERELEREFEMPFQIQMRFSYSLATLMPLRVESQPLPLLSPRQMLFGSCGALSVHSNNRCAARVHGNMSTARSCWRDSALRTKLKTPD